MSESFFAEVFSPNLYPPKLLGINVPINFSISNTHFKHRMLHRYTWYSNDGKTRKIIDYILAEEYVQQYMTNCRVYRGIDIDTDYRLLKATMCTPTSRKARKRYNKTPLEPRCCVKSLLNEMTRKTYSDSIEEKLRESPNSNNLNTFSEQLIQSIQMVANKILPKKKKVVLLFAL